VSATATTTVLPPAKAVRDLLEDLLGRDIEVSPSEPLVPGVKEPAAVAVYVDKGLRTCAVVTFDLALSAYAGAAIGLIPKGGAEACLEEGELTPMVRDNLSEVLNIFSVIFQKPNVPAVRLYGVYEPGELPPADVSAYARTVGRRLDVTVKVAGYGFGRLAVVAL
jgi:hypothetical protein